MACGTCGLRALPAAPVPDENLVAPHVVRMLLAVAAHVIGARSVDFLLQRIRAAKIIRMPGPPLLIGLSLLLAPAGWPATGLLPLLEPRMRMKPTTAKRTPPPLGHALLLRGTSGGETNRGDGKEEEKSKRERLQTMVRPKSEVNQRPEEQDKLRT